MVWQALVWGQTCSNSKKLEAWLWFISRPALCCGGKLGMERASSRCWCIHSRDSLSLIMWLSGKIARWFHQTIHSRSLSLLHPSLRSTWRDSSLQWPRWWYTRKMVTGVQYWYLIEANLSGQNWQQQFYLQWNTPEGLVWSHWDCHLARSKKIKPSHHLHLVDPIWRQLWNQWWQPACWLSAQGLVWCWRKIVQRVQVPCTLFAWDIWQLTLSHCLSQFLRYNINTHGDSRWKQYCGVSWGCLDWFGLVLAWDYSLLHNIITVTDNFVDAYLSY
jgi:hypothetical protein